MVGCMAVNVCTGDPVGDIGCEFLNAVEGIKAVDRMFTYYESDIDYCKL